MKKLFYYLCLSGFLSTGCGDCNQNANGIVFDKLTMKPIDSVYVHKVGSDNGEFTDSTGAFKISAISGGVFGCPIMKVAFVKDGYDTFAEEFDNSGHTKILMEKRTK